MTTATKRLTKAAVLKLIRAKHGPKSELRHTPHALDEAGKRIERASLDSLRSELASVKEQLGTLGNTTAKLIEAARFCVDVDAQEPSLSQLRSALERSEMKAELLERKAEIVQGLQTNRLHTCRYTALEHHGFCWVQVAGADTLEELAAKIGE